MVAGLVSWIQISGPGGILGDLEDLDSEFHLGFSYDNHRYVIDPCFRKNMF